MSTADRNSEQQLWKKCQPFDDSAHRTFQTPKALWDKALEYFKWCDDNPHWKTEQVSKPDKGQMIDNLWIPGEKLIDIPVKRLYTKGGFCIFASVYQKWIYDFVADRKPGGKLHKPGNEEQELFLIVIKRIYEVIETQQIEGASAGFFNANIVSRLNNLAEHTEAKVEQTTKQVFKIGEQTFEM